MRRGRDAGIVRGTRRGGRAGRAGCQRGRSRSRARDAAWPPLSRRGRAAQPGGRVACRSRRLHRRRPAAGAEGAGLVMRRIPATIVTGFLGAGKTSLVRHLMATASGHRLAIIVNEFGELGIDRDVLLGCGDATCAEDDILELANGCLCCTVADDFLPTLSRLIDRPEPPGHIVIETSGLALPKPLVQAFAWPEIRTRMTVDGVVTVIDAAAAAEGRFASDPDAVARRGPLAHGLVPWGAADPALDHDNPLEEVFSDQLACADLVILNKSDLLEPALRAATRATLAARLRPSVKLVEAMHGALPPALLLGLAAAAEDDLTNRPS